MRYAEVILPLPLANSYTYRIPDELESLVVPGCRVMVYFGRKRSYTALVWEVHDRAPQAEQIVKEVYALVDSSPVVRPLQLRFWQWIASYYICRLGDVYKAAIPSAQGFQPKRQLYVRLAVDYRKEERLLSLLDSLKRAKKQEQLLLRFLDLTQALVPGSAAEMPRKTLLEQCDASAAVLDGLLKRGVLEAYEKKVERQWELGSLQEMIMKPLSEEQTRAFVEIQSVFKEKAVCLLQGVTSCGKTEIYAHLIAEELRQGRQVLYLLPEIAITTQIMERLGKYFGNRLLVYHSKFSDNERAEVWNRLLQDEEPVVILGVRSSLFLPFSRLGLIIVDEEQETSYKQQDPAPRYHARNAAIILANLHGGKTLLGSATPSLDSYFNAITGKYGLVELTTRYGDCRMPEILTVNTRELKRKKIMKDTLFSPLLVEKMQEALACGEQVILFQNRRGFAPMVECRQCGWVPHCVNCDVSLTYHKAYRTLTCHYCGYTTSFPIRCPDCESEELRLQGFGTEQVEEEVTRLFPEIKVDRLDFDTARTRTAYERIIADFERGKTHILIGTQMLSKGLDFGRVSVVGILSADSLMNFPDFRAHERAFQLMVQVSGRAGRREQPGVVVLQTSQPDHPLIDMVQRFAYKEMVRMQLAERSQFRYPPYYRLIVVVLRGKQETTLREMALLYADRLRSRLGDRVLGPVTPPIHRIQALFLRQIVIKVEITAGITPLRAFLEEVHQYMQTFPAFRSLLLHYDVDPV